MDGHPLFGIMVIIITILNALIRAAKTAVNFSNEAAIRKKASDGDEKAIKLLKFFDNPDRYMLVSRTILIIFAFVSGILYIYSFYYSIKNALLRIEGFENESLVIFLMVIITILICALIILIGTLLPIRLARRNSEKVAYKLFGVLRLFTFIFFPICFVLEKANNGVLRIFGINPHENLDNVTEEEIISIVNEGHEQGVLEADEVEMISNIIEFDEKEAKDIMTHRKKIVAISYDSTIKEALNFMLNEKHSRYPIYKEDIDNIVGIINLKDAMKFLNDNPTSKATVMKIFRKPYFVPDTQKIDDLFKEMQRAKNHIAIAIDEYGQTAGIVAMEDILEEIVGDIQDEYDNEEETITRLEDGSFSVKGDAQLDQLLDETQIEIDEEELNNFDTLNGLLISRLNRIPNDSEKPIIEYAGYKFEVMETRNKMIVKVRMSKLETVDSLSEESSDKGNEDLDTELVTDSEEANL